MNQGADLERAADLIRSSGSRIGLPLELLDETASTNDVAKRAAKLGAPHGATWIAETQTEGRGQKGRGWFGVRGESLLMSALVRLRCPPARLPLLSLVVGVAVRDAVARRAPARRVGIKWPNDVVSEGRKLAGILVEAMSTAGEPETPVIIGVGLNVHTRSFPEALEGRATSVSLLARDPVDRAEILVDILQSLDRDLALVAARGLGIIHDRLSAADALFGEPVAMDDGRVGVGAGIDLSGRFRLRLEDGGIATVSSGEARILTRGS